MRVSAFSVGVGRAGRPRKSDLNRQCRNVAAYRIVGVGSIAIAEGIVVSVRIQDASSARRDEARVAAQQTVLPSRGSASLVDTLSLVATCRTSDRVRTFVKTR